VKDKEEFNQQKKEKEHCQEFILGFFQEKTYSFSSFN